MMSLFVYHLPSLIFAALLSALYFVVLMKAGFATAMRLLAFAPFLGLGLGIMLTLGMTNIPAGGFAVFVAGQVTLALLGNAPLIVLALTTWPIKSTLTLQDGM